MNLFVDNESEISLGDFKGVVNNLKNIVDHGGRACKIAFSEAGASANNVTDNGG